MKKRGEAIAFHSRHFGLRKCHSCRCTTKRVQTICLELFLDVKSAKNGFSTFDLLNTSGLFNNFDKNLFIFERKRKGAITTNGNRFSTIYRRFEVVLSCFAIYFGGIRYYELYLTKSHRFGIEIKRKTSEI